MSRSRVRMLSCIIAVLALLMSLQCVYAEGSAAKPFLHTLFTDHMVLQREAPINVWGWTEPGKTVTVRLGGKSASAVADASGKWMAKLPAFQAGGPYTLTVVGSQKRIIKDVLVGDVWVCSGQSNMEVGIYVVKNAEDEVAKADHPSIRLFQVKKDIALSPKETTTGVWDVCTPANISKANFSAVAYFFGRKLNQDLKVPIGLIQSAWGGTLAEAWTSAEALGTMDDFKYRVADFIKWSSDPNRPTYTQKMQPWWKANDPVSASAPGWEDPSTDISGWKTMKAPGFWENAGLPDFDGIAWFVKEIDLPADWSGKDAVLGLGAVDDMDTTWVNGVNVGESHNCEAQREYLVPAGTLKPGKNIITVRILDTGGLGGFFGKPDDMCLKLSATDTKISLAGDWKYKVSVDLAKVQPLPERVDDDNPNCLSVLYNGMIAPITSYGIKGAIWYQGEANADRARQYQTLLPTMIKDWRSRFGVGDFPFLIVQLAGYMDPTGDPVQPGWAELREAQLIAANRVPKCGLAVAVDIGEANDIHPKNKQDVGLRLALAAEGIAYDQKIEYSGPIYDSMKVDGKSIRINFQHIGDGLCARNGGKLKGFAIAGVDKKFVWADAVIDGETVVVSSPSVENPVAVRYDWANCPNGNLYNKADLPASPFRTDPE